MIIREYPYVDEFWGADVSNYEYEYEVEEEYPGEVKDIILDDIFNLVYEDSLPDVIEVYDEDGGLLCVISPIDYLSEEDIDLLNKLIQIVNNYTVIKYKKNGKYMLYPWEENTPEGWVDLGWSDETRKWILNIIEDKDKINKRYYLEDKDIKG